jgi:hypothetical protein
VNHFCKQERRLMLLEQNVTAQAAVQCEGIKRIEDKQQQVIDEMTRLYTIIAELLAKQKLGDAIP